MTKEPVEIVLVSGPAGHGKGTVGKALDLFHGFTVLSLAAPFKVPMVLHEDGQLVKEIEAAGQTVRRGWQEAGQAKEAVDVPDLWSAALASWIHYLAELHPSPRRRFAVCDFRFPVEEHFLRSFALGRGMQLLQVDVERPGVANRAGTTHVSETARSGLHPDLRLLNDGSVRDLAHAVDRAFPGAWKFMNRGASGKRPYLVRATALANGTEIL